MFQRLKAYANETGSARPAVEFRTSDGFALSRWVKNQRKRQCDITPERKRLLENLKGWSWDPIADYWNEAFEQLKAYTNKTGAARPPQSFKSPDGFPLGIWVGRQRTKRAELSDERKRRLESLKGWSWGVR